MLNRSEKVYPKRFQPKQHTPLFVKSVGLRKIRERYQDAAKQKSKKTFRNWLEDFARETSSSLHGLSRLSNGELNRKERVFWSLVLLITLMCLICVYLIIANRFRNAQLETIIDTATYPVYKIPFPEVTICNNNRLNWSRLSEAKKLFLSSPAHQDNTSMANAFEDILARYDSLIYGRFELFNELPSKQILESLNYINFTNAVHFMAWRCDEMFETCHWQHRRVNCCEVIFPRISQLGSCLAFNSIESRQGILKKMQDPKWPWRIGKHGPGSALKLRIRLNEKDHLSSSVKGIRFMMSETYVWVGIPVWVPTFSQAIISIAATINVRDEATMAVPASERGCVFENEKGDHNFKKLNGYEAYMLQNCESECQQETLMRYCNCTMDLFFPRSSYKVCQLIDMPCLAQYNYRMQRFLRSAEKGYTLSTNSTAIPCTCLLKCKFSLRFSPQTHINAVEETPAYANNSFIDMDMYFRYGYIFQYKTKLVFSWLDLLVSFGGIAGLFMGFSMITLVDFMYFFIKNKLK